MCTLPSEEQIWRRYYPEGLEERIHLPEGVSLWEYFRGILESRSASDVVLSYHGSRMSVSSFLKEVERAAGCLSGMGVKEGEEVLCYFASTPVELVLILALNRIGATPIFMNLAMSGDVLRESVRGVRFAFVTDVLFFRVADLAYDDTFERTVVVNLSQYATGIPRMVMDHKTKASRKGISYSDRVMRYSDFLKRFRHEPVDAAYKPDRAAIITCSSGSTGVPKEVIATDSGVLASAVTVAECTRGRYDFSHGTFNHAPPFVSTSLDILVLAPIILGVTINFVSTTDPDAFNDELISSSTSVTVSPGSSLAYLEYELRRRINNGRRPDMSTMSLIAIGGDGINAKSIDRLNSTMHECGFRYNVVAGYGQSEAFSILTAGVFDNVPEDKDTPGCPVSIPIPGYTIGVFDEDGNELGYGQPGEIWYTGPSLFKGYRNIETCNKAGRWIRSGDCGIINSNGCLFVLGRLKDVVKIEGGSVFRSFMAERALETDPVVYGAAAIMKKVDGRQTLYVHLRTDGELSRDDAKRLYDLMSPYVPEGLAFGGFCRHEVFVPNRYTFKVDREKYMEQTDGFILP